MLQSSDEEADDEEGGALCVTVSAENEELPILDTIAQSIKKATSAMQHTLHLKVYSPKRVELQEGGYVLCEATQCRAIFKELIFEDQMVDIHMGTPYMWVCGATLQIED